MAMENLTPHIQWFPGHMAKTRRIMTENLGHVDILIELRDARIPVSSANPEIEKLAGRKPRLVLLNKCDLSDAGENKKWRAQFLARGVSALCVDCRSGRGLSSFRPAVEAQLGELLERRMAKGMKIAPVRMMIVGVPNVGKSSLINRLAGGKRAKTADRPGVTRGKQWIHVEGGMELLDMPGVLWPKFEDKWVGENLALTGAVKDDVIDIEALAARLCQRLAESWPRQLCERYGLAEADIVDVGAFDILTMIARKRGMLLPGGAIDLARVATAVLDEFRGGKIGRITLEQADKFVGRRF